MQDFDVNNEEILNITVMIWLFESRFKDLEYYALHVHTIYMKSLCQ